MASRNQILDSDQELADSDLAQSSEGEDNATFRTPSPEPAAERISQVGSALSHRFRESPQKASSQTSQKNGGEEDTIVVMVPPPQRPWEYQPFRRNSTVESVLEELTGRDGETLYRVEYEDGRQEDLTFHKLSNLRNGTNALDFYNNGERSNSIVVDTRSSSDRSMSSVAGKRTRRQPVKNNFVTSYDSDDDDDDEDSSEDPVPKKPRLHQSTLSGSSFNKARGSNRTNIQQASRLIADDEDEDEEDGSESDEILPRRSGRVTRSAGVKQTAVSKASTATLRDDYDDEEEDELAANVEVESDNSDIAYISPKKKKRPNAGRQGTQKSKRGRPFKHRQVSSNDSSPERPTRVSGRGNKTNKSMREIDMDEEMYADDVAEKNAPKVISIREVYQPIPKNSDFRFVHDKDCDVCGGTGRQSNKGTSELIYCQGCSSSIHKVCLGYRSNREHMVTKVGHQHFILQCRRCIGLAIKKDHLAPRLDVCTVCREPGPSCAAFSVKRTTKQEEKLREENNGDDPITEVDEDLINNPDNILFRCRSCQRGYHYEHLPPLSDKSLTSDDIEELRNERYDEYTQSWQCKECFDTTSKIDTLVAWRPLNRDSYQNGQTFDMIREDDKEYLVKWEEKSYFQCSWMPGAWVWGVAAAAMRKGFGRRDDGKNMYPKFTFTEAVPEEFLRMEIVFDVNYHHSFRSKSETHDKAHINDVDSVLVKFRGLTYAESVWEAPPEPDDTDRWSDFVAAYNEYVMGKYFKQVPVATINERVDAFRSLDFENKVELKKQPSALIGGEMMSYQMEGVNWLLYNFHEKRNVILADEMGLGKTIQIIALMASLVKDKPKCWPFLVVTPNSTCPNWRREIKKWAPDLRVVAYYGAKSARDMAMKYELFPEGCSDLRAHVVVTSYEAPVDEHSRLFFKRTKWAGMIVDEGQRLKNDGNLLYGALSALKVPFQVLLTGTPLQNNKRELFNLLQFLDKDNINAAELDEKYAELTNENLPELQDLIRPFFLRRTKLQVLKFLPPMAQVILPVTMSVLQKKLYKSILAKNPDLMKSIFDQTKKNLRATDRGNLNNILMQLRKCLCHPFVYSSAIEETSVGESAAHRNLIDASSKLQLLEIMLPKLRERGHRVLIFSQFLNQLDIIEDFLNGLDLPFQRLDGTISTLEKQSRIDEFNAPDSPLFAFLLSTRAGGVGINLATADTVIILPHQDIQALSRAHRIGQKKKVLVFQLMTKDSAEEKIVQIGRKKMALDHALIETLDAEDDAGVDLESILRHGAGALFNDDDRNDIRYDSASVDKLLDRAQVENTDTNDEKTAESQFSHARVWAQDKGALSDDVGDADDDDAEISGPNVSVWHAILKEREAEAAREAAKNRQTFGRGKRARHAVDYEKSQMDLDDVIDSPPLKKDRRRKRESMSDTEFAAAGDSNAEDTDVDGDVDPRELETSMKEDDHSGDYQPQQRYPQQQPNTNAVNPEPNRPKKRGRPFKNPEKNNHHISGFDTPQSLPSSTITFPSPYFPQAEALSEQHAGNETEPAFSIPFIPPQTLKPEVKKPKRKSKDKAIQHAQNPLQCPQCLTTHVPGPCHANIMEYCNLCGIAHFGDQRPVCPHLHSEVQIRLMLDALRFSLEDPDHVAAAIRLLRKELADRAARRQSGTNGNASGHNQL